MAPEVLDGNLTDKCDLWSVGCILYTMLTGFPPFNAKSDAEILAKVRIGRYSEQTLKECNLSEEVKDFIKRLLTKDPSERPSAAEALQDPWIIYHSRE